MDLPFLGVSNFIDEQIKSALEKFTEWSEQTEENEKEANPRALFWLLVVSRLFSKMFSISDNVLYAYEVVRVSFRCYVCRCSSFWVSRASNYEFSFTFQPASTEVSQLWFSIIT